MGQKVTAEDAWNARMEARRLTDPNAEALVRDERIDIWRATQEGALDSAVAQAKALDLTPADENLIRSLQKLPNKLKAAVEVRKLIERVTGRTK